MNSFANVERAIHFEIGRQRAIRAAGGAVGHETLLWDAGRGEARSMRSKEESHDYRYFPDPDLPPLEIEPARLEAQRAALPEMPWARAARLEREWGLSRAHAEQLTATRELADYYEAVVAAGAGAQEAASWVMGDLSAAANARGFSIVDFPVRPPAVAELLGLLGAGTISRPIARDVFARMIEGGGSPKRIVEEAGLVQVGDADAIEGWVDEALAANADAVQRFRDGDAKLMGFFVGAVMKLSRGKADPKRVNALLREKLGG